MQCGCLFPCARAQTGEYATDEEEEAGQTGTDRDVAIEVFDLPENEDIISPSELDATQLYQKFQEVNHDCMHFFLKIDQLKEVHNL